MTKARVSIEGDMVVFRPAGLARVWATLSDVRAPLSEVTSVRTTDNIRSVWWGVRWYGTAGFGVIAGWMGWPWRRAWWCVGRGRPVLVVDTPARGTKRVVVSTDDPRGDAEKLRAAIDARQ